MSEKKELTDAEIVELYKLNAEFQQFDPSPLIRDSGSGGGFDGILKIVNIILLVVTMIFSIIN